MDDEDVALQFTADVAEAVAAVEELRDAAQELAVSAQETQAGLDGVRDDAAETAAAMVGVRDSSQETSVTFAELAAAAGVYRDEMGKLRDAQGRFTSEAAVMAMAIGHTRDEALEAAAALKEERDAAVEAGGAANTAAAGGLAGISAMAVGMAALIGLVAALAPAFVAVGAGVGAFALFAIPTIKQVTGALGDNKAQLDKLPVPIRLAVDAVKSLESQWKNLARAFQPEVLTAFGEGLSIAGDLMQKIVPIAVQGAFAVNRMLESLKSGVDSSGFTTFLNTLSSLVLPATDALTRLAGTIAGILGQAIEQLAPMAVPMIDMLNGLLKAAGPALVNGLQFIAQAVMDIGKAITPVLGPLGALFGYLDKHPVFAQIAAGILGVVAAVRVWSVAMGILDAVLDANPIVLIGLAVAALAILIATHTHQIAQAFDVVRHAIATAGHDIASVFDGIRHTVASWGHDIASTFDTVRHDIAAAVGDVVNFLKSNWKLILAILLDPIGTAVMEIRQHWTEIEGAFKDGWHAVVSALDSLRHDIATAWDNIRHDVAAAVDAIPGLVEKAFDTVRHDVAALGDDALSLIKNAWNQFVSVNETMIKDVLGFFEKLPGQITNFLASLPGKMLDIGKNVITGLINGIKDAAAAIPGIMSSLASDVASYFTDPLKLFSPSRLFHEYGFNTIQGAINGVRENTPALLAAVRGAALGVAAAGTASTGYGTVAQSVPVAGAIAPAGGMTHNVNVTVNAQGAAVSGLGSAQYQQDLQRAVQEVTLRHAQINPNNGLTPAWGR